MSFRVEVKGLDQLKSRFAGITSRVQQAETHALSSATRYGYAESSRGIRSQINVTQSYIGSASSGNRLKVTQWPSAGNPMATITARFTPTSLARFATDKSLAKRKSGVRVKVKPTGGAETIPGAFLMKLSRGASLTHDNYNLGLAIRLANGAKVRNKHTLKPYGGDPNLYLLYGPAVYQVFRDVAIDVSPSIEKHLRAEFLRQLGRV